MKNAISVKDRLKNRAFASGKTMQELLTTYGLERTIYRISISKYAKRFTLKGGIFLYALFDGEFARATRDIDLLAKNIPNNREDMKYIFEKIFSIRCDDALEYKLSSLEIKEITELNEYHGVSISVMAYLDKTEVPISIDIGFDDVIYPKRVEMEFPVLLDMEHPKIYAYSIYSVISEKFEAIVSLGEANSRYKDFYDIYILAEYYQLDGKELKKAITETFNKRGSELDDIIIFNEDFKKSELHQNRWKAFLKKKKAMVDVEFGVVVEEIKLLLTPIVTSIENNVEFMKTWSVENKKWM